MKKIFSVFLGFWIGVIANTFMVKKKFDNRIKGECLRSTKLQEFYDLLLLWLELKQKEGTFEIYFVNNQYKSVAIYGMKEIGEALYQELENIGIEIRYLIDKNADIIYADKEIYLPEDNLPEVDVIIVTALHYYSEIEKELSAKFKYPVVNLKDIIYESLSYQFERNI